MRGADDNDLADLPDPASESEGREANTGGNDDEVLDGPSDASESRNEEDHKSATTPTNEVQEVSNSNKVEESADDAISRIGNHLLKGIGEAFAKTATRA